MPNFSRISRPAVALVLPLMAVPAEAQVVTRHFTSADQESQRYVAVPLDIPAGTTTLTVTYRYDRRDGANTIDAGLFEPGPLTLGSKAFRGWSGGSLSTITVGVADASPGYWPGPMPAGEWHLILGLYKIAPEGVDVTITTTTSSAAASPAPSLPVRSPAPLRTGSRWYTGIVHSHTIESDGALTVPELIEKAEREHLDFLFITDHNNTTHQRYALDRPALLVVTGEEVTTPAGHFNVWGLGGARDYVDFRFQAGDRRLDDAMEAARGRGAVIGINHPFTDCLACTWTHAIPDAVSAIEIANGTPIGRQQALALWDTLLRSGRRVTAVEGRDWHRGTDALAAPVVRVWADELSQRALLDGICQGRAIVMATGALPVPEFSIASGQDTARIGDTLRLARGQTFQATVAIGPEYRGARVEYVWNGETVDIATVADRPITFTRTAGSSGYARVHLVGADGAPLAITNPIYVTVHQ